jgi:hypothetical protein
MADEATKKRLLFLGLLRRGVLGAFGLGLGLGLYYGWGWSAEEFIKSYFSNHLALLGWSPDDPRVKVLFAPLAGFVLGLIAAEWTPVKKVLKKFIPDPPSFVRSDLEVEKKKTMINTELAPVKLVGRSSDLTNLINMARAKKPACWQAVIGPPGVGKSRLMIEWLQELAKEGWDVGVVDSKDSPPEDWRPRKKPP